MKKNELVFIGPMNLGRTPGTGDTMKNQLMLDCFLAVFDKVIAIDTIDWKKHPLVMVRLVFVLLYHRTAKIIISANPVSADLLIRFIKRMRLKNDCFYWVVGGSFHNRIKEGRFSVSTYFFLKGIIVQGKSMVDSLNKSGLNNAVYVPNSKLIVQIEKKQPRQDNRIHFVFLSRIEEYKGCSDIIKSVDALNRLGYRGKYDVTFYGRESEDRDYAKKFRAMIDNNPDVEYRGLLNLRDTKKYEELAQFDIMLFPTYWQGEGFPGIVIDAYIASLPIIASDWNLNRDVIEDGVTGWIIPTRNIEALTDRMKYSIDHPNEVKKMAQACRERAIQFDSRVVLSKSNLKKIGLID